MFRILPGIGASTVVAPAGAAAFGAGAAADAGAGAGAAATGAGAGAAGLCTGADAEEPELPELLHHYDPEIC